jgi:hypothetical protein
MLGSMLVAYVEEIVRLARIALALLMEPVESMSVETVAVW